MRSHVRGGAGSGVHIPPAAGGVGHACVWWAGLGRSHRRCGAGLGVYIRLVHILLATSAVRAGRLWVGQAEAQPPARRNRGSRGKRWAYSNPWSFNDSGCGLGESALAQPKLRALNRVFVGVQLCRGCRNARGDPVGSAHGDPSRTGPFKAIVPQDSGGFAGDGGCDRGRVGRAFVRTKPSHQRGRARSSG